MRHIKDEATLIKYIERDMRLVLDDVGAEILEIMHESLDKWIYEYHKPNKYYANGFGFPTHEFWKSWRKFVRKSKSNGLALTVNSDKNKMGVDNSEDLLLGVHGSSWTNQSSKNSDIRSALPKFINEGVGAMDTWYNKPRPFFDDVINKLDSGGYIWIMIKQKMKQRGLNVI
ncbi:MAG: hypothetical protein RR322_04210 [Oscillospiraceae bacterium]